MKIIENKDNFLSDFVRLNKEWITHNFAFEYIDRELAANPKKVIDDGGYIFTIVADNTKFESAT